MRKLTVSFCLIAIGVIYILFRVAEFPEHSVYSWPHLPAPIGKETVLITSAGQAPEGSVMEQIASQLHIDIDYRPRALATDLYEYQTLVFVIGFSSTSLVDMNRTFEGEIARVKELINEAKLKSIPIILIHLGGAGRMDPQTVQLLDIALPFSQYLIGLRSADYNGMIREMASMHNVPYTLVKGLQDIKTPFNSVFR